MSNGGSNYSFPMFMTARSVEMTKHNYQLPDRQNIPLVIWITTIK